METYKLVCWWTGAIYYNRKAVLRRNSDTAQLDWDTSLADAGAIDMWNMNI